MNYFAPFLSLLLFACSANSDPSTTTEEARVLPYNLHQPKVTHVLPKELVEISGLSDFDENHVACVQDENGIIYIIDLETGGITQQYDFEPLGDFEGITFIDPSFYVLRSDGRITLIPNFPEPANHQNIKAKIPTKDNEGLCYDVTNHRLLIAGKSKPTKESNLDKEDRLIYQLDLEALEIDVNPLFTLKIDEVERLANEAGLDVPVKKKSKNFNFRPSSLAVHPTTQQIYILSAADYLLLVCDEQGELVSAHVLDPQLFPKAEGITFLADGTMIIANEGDKMGGTLLMFDSK